MADRYDNKKRKLNTGERQLADGRYRYRYKDNDGRWQDVYSWTLTRHDRVPVDKNQKSGESLREKEAQIQKQLLEGLNASKGNMTVYDLMELYISIKIKDVKETTKAGYRTQLKFMSTNYFGKKKIKDVDETTAVLWFDELHEKQGKNYSTLHTLRGILRPAFTMAKKNRWIAINPFDFPMLKKRYGGTKTRQALTRKDMRRFLDFVRTDKHFSMYFDGVYILFNTGLRISEFCGLTESDIDFTNHVIVVNKQLKRLHDGNKDIVYMEDTTKTAAGERKIPMTADVESCFKNVLAKKKSLNLPQEPVVATLDGANTYTGFLWFDKNKNLEVAQHWQNHLRWARQKFNKIYKDELPEISPHVCRHTFCSNMASAGMSPKTLQIIMGHSSIGVTLDIYTHLEDVDINDEFVKIINNPQYSMYPLDRKPDVVSSEEDSEEDEPEMIEYTEEEDEE